MWLILISSFHPNVQNYIYLNDKVMHFLAFMTVRGSQTWLLPQTTYLCYRMWEVDQVRSTILTSTGFHAYTNLEVYTLNPHNIYKHHRRRYWVGVYPKPAPRMSMKC